MSRPHDGHPFSSFFGNPFRIIIRKRSLSFNSRQNQVLKGFETALAERLKQLKLQKPEGFINLIWLQKAMEVVCSTHVDLRSLIQELQFPLTKWDEKWMDEYLDDTVKLLDICIALNAEVSKLEQVQLLVQYILHLLDFSHGVPPSDKVIRAKGALQDLTEKTKAVENSGESQTICKSGRCAVMLQGMNKSFRLGKMKCSGKGKVFLRAMYGVKVITIFVCSILVSALSGVAHSLVELHIPDRLLWSAPFMSLQREVNEEVRGRLLEAPVVLKELEGLNASVKSVHSTIQILRLGKLEGKCKAVQVTEGSEEVEQIRQGVQELGQSAELLSQGLDCLSKQVNEFFQIVLNGRKALLDSLRLSEGKDMFGEDECVKE